MRAAARPKKRKDASPREEWVLEDPHHYVVRRFSQDRGWETLGPLSRDEAVVVARSDHRFLMYAVRLNGDEEHLALMPVDRTGVVQPGTPLRLRITNVVFTLLQETFPENKRNHIVARTIAEHVHELIEGERRTAANGDPK